MRVAFTSTTGERIDEHFGMAEKFHIWEVGPEEARFVTEIPVPPGGDEEDKIAARARALAGCAIVYTLRIGGPAAAKLVGRRIHPMKTGGEVAVAEVLGKLQEVLKGNPPPWLKKAMSENPTASD